jgi:hypothetical protein
MIHAFAARPHHAQMQQPSMQRNSVLRVQAPAFQLPISEFGKAARIANGSMHDELITTLYGLDI